ncbi:MAG: S24 family peptidase [Pseudomonadota bacterium]|jgi:SOS-response transcriptional repressor LexA|nr:S24 family peptidase [Pseudomonadota bacterium]
MTQRSLVNIEHLRKVLETATAPGTEWNARSLSLAATGGKSPHIVREILRGRSNNPTLETLVGLSRALGIDISRLVSGGEGVMPRVGGVAPYERLQVLGAVAAGVWREQTEWPEEDRYFIEVGPSPVVGGERFALRMEGNSMDKLIPPGSDLECLRTIFGEIEPVPGDIVIVQRDRHDMHELTCKRLDHDGKNYILRAESTRPEFQEPIIIGRPDADNFSDDGVQIIGIVLRAHQRLYSRR